MQEMGFPKFLGLKIFSSFPSPLWKFGLALVSIYEIEVTLFYQQTLSTNAEY